MPNSKSKKGKSKKLKQQSLKEVEVETFSCGLCTSVDHGEMVQCDDCDTWFHFECVDLISITEEESWICPTCIDSLTVIEAQQNVTGHQGNASGSHSVILRAELPKHRQELQQIEDDSANTPRMPRRDNDVPSSENQRQSIPGSRGQHPILNNDFISDRLYTHRAHYDQFMARQFMSPPASQSFLAQRQTMRNENPMQFVHSTPTQQLYWPRQQLEQVVLAARINYQRPSLHLEQQQEVRPIHEQQPNYERSRMGTPNSDRQYVSAQQDLASSVRSGSIRSTARRTQIELQRLEEEKRAQKEYLDQKYRILLQNCDRDDVTDRRSFTDNWVNNLSIDRMNDFASSPQNQVDFLASHHSRQNSIVPSEVEPKPVIGSSIKNDFSQLRQTNQNPVAWKFNPAEGALQEQPQVLTKNQIASRHVVTRDLPAFDGNPKNWLLFYSRYRNSTKLCGYTDAENLDRLQKCLKGRALTVVKHRLLMPEALPGVIATLKLLFGRPELVINQLVNKVTLLPPPRMDKLDTLVDFAMAVQDVSDTIKLVELNEHLSNPTLITGLVNKIPVNIRLDWARYKMTQPVVTLSTLADWLYNLAEVVATVTEPEFTASIEKKTTVSTTHPRKSFEFQRKKQECVNAHQEGLKSDVQSKSKEEKDSIPTSRQNLNKSCLRALQVKFAQNATFSTWNILNK